MYALWATVGLVLEVPSGALADRVDRRRLLAAAFGLRAVGITILIAWPTTTGALIGVALWAAHSATASGAWEAAIHDQLASAGAADRYTAVMARVSQYSYLGIAAGTLVAGGALRWGGSIAALGWLSVAAHIPAMVLVLRLPAGATEPTGAGGVPSPVDDEDGADDREPASYQEWWATLRAGLAVALRHPVTLRLVVIGGLLEGLFVADEYVALLGRSRGVSDAVIPLLVLVVFVGALAGGELVARRPALSGRAAGAAIAAGASLVAGSLWSNQSWLLVLIGLSYVPLEAARVAADGRLQAHAPQATRATVTSVRSFLTSITGLAAFGAIALVSRGEDPTAGLAIVVAALLATGLAAARWLKDSGLGYATSASAKASSSTTSYGSSSTGEDSASGS